MQRMRDGDLLQPQHLLVAVSAGAGRVEVVDLAADHRRDDPPLAELRALQLGDLLAVAQDGRAVAHPHHLGDPVGDEDHRRAGVAEPVEHAEEAAGLGAGERGRRLVEDQHARVGAQRAGDHHQLPLGRAQRRDRAARVDRDLHPLEQLAGAAVQLAEGDARRGVEPGLADEEVLGDRQLLDDLDLLRHVGDALGARVGRGGEADDLAVELDGAVVGAGRPDAGQDLDERRLAGAVVADQRVDLAGLEPEVDAAEGRHAGELLAEPLGFEHVGHDDHRGRAERRCSAARSVVPLEALRGLVGLVEHPFESRDLISGDDRRGERVVVGDLLALGELAEQVRGLRALLEQRLADDGEDLAVSRPGRGSGGRSPCR